MWSSMISLTLGASNSIVLSILVWIDLSEYYWEYCNCIARIFIRISQAENEDRLFSKLYLPFYQSHTYQWLIFNLNYISLFFYLSLSLSNIINKLYLYNNINKIKQPWNKLKSSISSYDVVCNYLIVYNSLISKEGVNCIIMRSLPCNLVLFAAWIENKHWKGSVWVWPSQIKKRRVFGNIH